MDRLDIILRGHTEANILKVAVRVDGAVDAGRVRQGVGDAIACTHLGDREARNSVEGDAGRRVIGVAVVVVVITTLLGQLIPILARHNCTRARIGR